ncbi:MAG: ectoine synthase [Leptospirillia bacterium]
MIVRRLADTIGTERDIRAENDNWVSRRFLLADDGMGFSFHETTIFAGTETYIHYKHHLEAVYCVGGEGELEDLDNGVIHPISDGTMYALSGHERHLLRARLDMRMICVFNPPLSGREVHGPDGAYPPPDLDDTTAETQL